MSITKTAQSGEWVTVPREPTIEMLKAVREAARAIRVSSISGMTVDAQSRAEWGRELAAYRAMLAASPPAPAAEPFGWVMTEGPIQLFSRTKPDSLVNRWVQVWDAPPPVANAAEPVAWPTDAELIAFGTEEQHFLSCDQDDYAQIALEILAKFGQRRPPPVEASQQQASEDRSTYREHMRSEVRKDMEPLRRVLRLEKQISGEKE